MGPGEVLPQQRGQGIRGLEREGGIRRGRQRAGGRRSPPPTSTATAGPTSSSGNVGLNTQYHASPERPALLYYGDFKGAGEEPQIVEAYYEGDRLYPWRSRRDLGAAIPSVLKRFPRNNAYARATLGEILGDDKLAAAQRFAATELRSGVFLSQPDGTYRFEALPRIAQISPLQGLVAGRFRGQRACRHLRRPELLRADPARRAF